MKTFMDAIERGDTDAALDTLANDVVFRSPAVHTPYVGKRPTSVILSAVNEVFEDFRYTRVLEDGADSVLVFEAHVGDKQLEGADFIHVNSAGLIDDFTVMIRPMKGLQAVVEGMAAAIPSAMQRLGVRPEEMKQ
ncbi:nuclear transport factor 2 family protein [Blastococcus sp. Marseille-P5729]|uniref:nuclear transport factor 2 family protein n=1 Tax=Blastococcus sp. Marseille-P5729 TaxID=2086582 RepID=UPI000D0F2A83|nr:nuclear transport factor 2 family protein [Blastococcus sp. Marseille-P5729]